MRKILPLILCIILLTSIVSNVSVHAESPIQEIGFESADEVRRFVLSTKESKEEYEEKNEGWGNYEIAKGISEKIEVLPFVTVNDGTQVDYSYFRYECRTDFFNEIWRMEYRINGVLYSFEYRFHATSAGNYYDKPCVEVDLDGYKHKLRLYAEDQKLKGSFWCDEVPLYITVHTLNEDEVDFSAFRLGELSLELDADKTTSVAQTTLADPTSQATNKKNENILSNAIIIGAIVVVTAAASSIITLFVVSKEKKKSNSDK